MMDGIYFEVQDLVKQVGRVLADYLFQENKVSEKGPADFVTQADYRIEKLIAEGLERITPGYNIITEESDRNEYRFDRPTWILDPVDGTTNLMYRQRHSAISLALLVHGVPVCGMIYNPMMEEFFYGESGKGAFLNGEGIRASDNSTLENCLIGFGTTPYNKKMAAKTFEVTECIFRRCRDIRRTGAAALDVAYVACGRLDGFYEMNLKPWDYAAGVVIIKEARGSITNWDGSSPDLLSSDSILATNGRIHHEILDLLNIKHL